ncbi:MAG: hypothetical protein AAFQ51_18665 [Pseudomonadota bacterium]
MFDLNDMDAAEEALMKLIGEALKGDTVPLAQPFAPQEALSLREDAPKCPFAGEVRA